MACDLGHGKRRDGNIEDNTLDQNLYTRWSAAGDGPWIMYDLGEARDIGYLGIAFYKGNVRATEIDIETSDDGVSWSPLFNGSSGGTTTAMRPFNVPDTSARYVKLTGRGNSDGSAYTSLTEVHIYPPFANGDTPVAIIPILCRNHRKEPSFTAPGMKMRTGATIRCIRLLLLPEGR